ncbi:Endonuclease/reverse transcriptase-like protein [Novymonas esmeraldas]|uniref:Endonuclease/reverse transcriptase-like protein n=1 Tax=Novymonas esmeraldas TaxID=1808958 RepID=A0AAW0F1F6_9TRYP
MVDIERRRDKVLFRIVNVYAAPGGTIDVIAVMEALHRLQSDIIAGDFNARHATWSPRSASTRASDSYARGSALYHWISSRGYFRSNDGIPFTPTTVPRVDASQTALDFVLLSRRVRPTTHWVQSAAARSLSLASGDRFPVILNAPSQTHAPPKRRHPQIRWALVKPCHMRHMQRAIAAATDEASMEQSMRRALGRLPRTGWCPRSPATVVTDDAVHDATSAWRLLRRVYTTVPPVVPLHTSSNTDAAPLTGPRAKASALNTFFASKHGARSHPLPEPPFTEHPTTQFPRSDVPPILAWEVSSAIHQLKSNKAMDNQGFSAELLKACRQPLSSTLPLMFTNILRDPRSMPTSWRTVTIVPLLKHGKDPSLISSYRPVCITSHFSRLLERILASRLLVVLHGRLSSRQFGYMPGRSPLDAASAVLGTAAAISKIYRNKRKGQHNPSTQLHGKTLVGYLDLSDAFCRVPHRFLFDRLAAYGVPAYLICFIRFWLWERSASTYVEGRYSAPATHYAGVPQGSVLGPLLFSVFIDTIVQSTHQRIQQRLRTPTATYAMIAAYVDDVTILVGGLRPDKIQSFITDLVQYIYSWCKSHDMELSAKSVFQWIYPTWNSITTTVNHFGGQLPPIRIFVDENARPTLHMVNGRLVAGSDSDTVSFETHKAITHRYLGITVDHKLTFAEHITERRAALDSFHARLLPFTKCFHPRVARTLVLGIAQSAVYGLPLLFPSASPQTLRPVQTAWAALVKRAGHITQLAAHADSMIEMGCPTIEMMVRKQAIKWNHARHTLPIDKESIYVSILPEWMDDDTPHHDLLVDPATVFGHRSLAQTPLPLLYPESPPPTVLDTVYILPHTQGPNNNATPRTPKDKLELNTARRREVYERYRDYTIYEGWSDGSVTHSEESGAIEAGGAAVIFEPGADHTRIRITENSPAPPNVCSYSAEVFAALTLLDTLIRLTQEDALLNPKAERAALICSDSLSWILHIARGPTMFGTLAPLFWRKLTALAHQVVAVNIVHCFSHCGDPRGDIVDAAAKLAGKRNIRTRVPWHVDAARDAVSECWTPLINAIVGEQRSTFHRGMLPDMETWMPSVRAVPPLQLHVKQSAMILQLRTGIWPSLGAHTFIRHLLAPFVCPMCQQRIPSEHGQPVAHLLTCPTANPTNPRQPSVDLWKNNAVGLRSLIRHALQFVPNRMPGGPASRASPGHGSLASPPLSRDTSPPPEADDTRPLHLRR